MPFVERREQKHPENDARQRASIGPIRRPCGEKAQDGVQAEVNNLVGFGEE